MFHISWDASTEAPPMSAAYRGKMLGILSKDNYSMQRDPKNIAMLEAVSQMTEIDPLDQFAAAKMLKEINKNAKIPQEEMVARQQDNAMAKSLEEARKQTICHVCAISCQNIEHNKISAEYRGYVGHPITRCWMISKKA